MGWVEIEEFELAGGVDEAAFSRLDGDFQAWSYLHRPGLVRRTTALGEGRTALVCTLYGGGGPPPPAEDDGTGALAAFHAAIEPASYRRALYRDLDAPATAGPG